MRSHNISLMLSASKMTYIVFEHVRAFSVAGPSSWNFVPDKSS